MGYGWRWGWLGVLHGAFRGALVSVALVRGYHAAGCCGFGRVVWEK